MDNTGGGGKGVCLDVRTAEEYIKRRGGNIFFLFQTLRDTKEPAVLVLFGAIVFVFFCFEMFFCFFYSMAERKRMMGPVCNVLLCIYTHTQGIARDVIRSDDVWKGGGW